VSGCAGNLLQSRQRRVRSTHAGTEHARRCSGAWMEQSTHGFREGIQPGAGDAWMMVGRQPPSLGPWRNCPRTKWHPAIPPLPTCTPTTAAGESTRRMHHARRHLCALPARRVAIHTRPRLNPRRHDSWRDDHRHPAGDRAVANHVGRRTSPRQAQHAQNRRGPAPERRSIPSRNP